MDGIGQAKAKRILQLRERKEDFNFAGVSDITQTEPSKWMTWCKAGAVRKKKFTRLSSANPRAQATSDTLPTTELNSGRLFLVQNTYGTDQ